MCLVALPSHLERGLHLEQPMDCGLRARSSWGSMCRWDGSSSTTPTFQFPIHFLHENGLCSDPGQPALDPEQPGGAMLCSRHRTGRDVWIKLLPAESIVVGRAGALGAGELPATPAPASPSSGCCRKGCTGGSSQPLLCWPFY